MQTRRGAQGRGAAVPTPGPLRKLADVCWGPCSWGDRGHGGAAKGSRGKILPKGARRCHFKPRFSHKHSVRHVIHLGRGPLW